MFRLVVSFAFGLCAVALVGCGDKPAPTTGSSDPKPNPGEFKPKKDEDGHEHKGSEKDVTLPGGKKCHAVLSAHFSKKGEKALELSFENFEKEPKPVTLPENTKISLRVQRGEKVETFELKPGPKDERKTDPAGQCSRFEADVDWLKPDDKLTAVTLTIEGVDKKEVWTDFDVKKYSHTHDD
jgi:hypothetical protein